MRQFPIEVSVDGQRCALRMVLVEVGAPAQSANDLSQEERRRYDTFRSPSRRATFLAGRIAAKQSAACYFGHDRLAGASIDNDALGCPRLYLAGEAAEVCVSISHTEQLAAGLISPPECRIGIDIMPFAKRFPRGMDHLLTPREKAIFADGRYLSEGLSAREAIAKHCGQGFGVAFDTYEIEDMATDVGGLIVTFRNFPDVQVRIHGLGDHMLSLACETRGDLRIEFDTIELAK